MGIYTPGDKSTSYSHKLDQFEIGQVVACNASDKDQDEIWFGKIKFIGRTSILMYCSCMIFIIDSYKEISIQWFDLYPGTTDLYYLDLKSSKNYVECIASGDVLVETFTRVTADFKWPTKKILVNGKHVDELYKFDMY